MPYHIPVLLDAVLDGLDPRRGQTLVDATLGGAGHALALARRLGPAGALIGIDQDADAIEEARRAFELLGAEFKLSAGALNSAAHEKGLPRILLLRARFDAIGSLLEHYGFARVECALFDLGVSSHQLDDPRRGFTFRDVAAPLDMRMDPALGAPTAADLLNTLSARDLAALFRDNADERWSARIAEFAVRRREKEPFRVAGQLIDTVKAAIPSAAWPRDIHPATRVFQALRMAVNEELEVLSEALGQAIDSLAPGGRLAVISYHSGEDRIVKRIFAARSGRCQCPPGRPRCDCGAASPSLRLVSRKPISATAEELRQNPRARSAKLRIAEKLAAS